MSDKKRVLQVSSLLLLFGALLLIVQFSYFGELTGITGFVVFEQNDETGFINGTYANTLYNGSSIVLFDGNVSGNYTSQIFDASSATIWNNISITRNIPVREYFLSVDGAADVWNSTDSGVTMVEMVIV
jgi:hypothetical protein